MQTSVKPRAVKHTSAPPSFISALKTARVARDSFSLLTARSAPPFDWCCWGRARRTMKVYFSELVLTNSETALSASVCNTTELMEDDKPKWSSHLQIWLLTFLASGVTTTYPMQLVANSVRTKILMVFSDSSSTISPRVVKNAKSAWTSVSNAPSRRRRWWKVDLPRAQMVHLGAYGTCPWSRCRSKSGSAARENEKIISDCCYRLQKLQEWGEGVPFLLKQSAEILMTMLVLIWSMGILHSKCNPQLSYQSSHLWHEIHLVLDWIPNHIHATL